MMKQFLPENLIRLAESCPFPLYLVGGSVRDFLRGALSEKPDWDLCSPAPEEALISAARTCGFTVKAVYKRTGTVKLTDADGAGYEFTRFRTDKYVRGLHAPSEILFTDDIALDARRRDFCANAVYYEIASGTFVDPLNGREDVAKGRLRTVAPADKVFGEDGLRLMRLARIAAETGFSPDEECLAGARKNAALIGDIVPERIFAELSLLLTADRKSGLGDAHYRGLKILHAAGVLAVILPELAAGEGIVQRRDFHDHDVLEHSLRCALYAPPEIRFAALLHDVGKPFCYLRDGNFYEHPREGARIAEEILTRLKAPKALTEKTKRLVLLHMRDYNLQMKGVKVRRAIVENAPLLPALLALFQADYSACKDDTGEAPVVGKWKSILAEMEREGAPRTPGELAVNGKELQAAGISPKRTGEALDDLLCYAAEDGRRNEKNALIARAQKLFSVNGDSDA